MTAARFYSSAIILAAGAAFFALITRIIHIFTYSLSNIYTKEVYTNRWKKPILCPLGFGEPQMEIPFELLYLPSLGILPYLILGLLAMAEGPVAILMSGAATSVGLLLPVPAYLSVVLGNLTADIGWYSLGRYCKLEWLARISPKVGLDIHRIDQLKEGIQKYAPRLLFLSKLTVGFPIPALVATGISRVPVRHWAVALVLGELIKSAAIILVGYLYARAIQQASSAVQAILVGITVAFLVIGVIWFKKRKKN